MAASLEVFGWWLAFAGSHLVLSSTGVRRPLIARLGERGFQGVYSAVALVTLVLLVRAYWSRKHAGPLRWSIAHVPGVRALAVALAAVAVVLAVVAIVQPSATGMAPGAARRARGVTRITRHGLFAGIGLWGAAHLLVNGHASDVAFFGGFPLFALVGSLHQDARKRAAPDGALEGFYAETSVLPFGAILAGRNRLLLREIPPWGVAVGAALAAALYVFHGRLFG
jgi:uncharacterized membrane protein